MALLQIENLNFTYPDADQRALNSISLSVDEGEFIVIDQIAKAGACAGGGERRSDPIRRRFAGRAD